MTQRVYGGAPRVRRRKNGTQQIDEQGNVSPSLAINGMKLLNLLVEAAVTAVGSAAAAKVIQ